MNLQLESIRDTNSVISNLATEAAAATITALSSAVLAKRAAVLLPDVASEIATCERRIDELRQQLEAGRGEADRLADEARAAATERQRLESALAGALVGRATGNVDDLRRQSAAAEERYHKAERAAINKGAELGTLRNRLSEAEQHLAALQRLQLALERIQPDTAGLALLAEALMGQRKR